MHIRHIHRFDHNKDNYIHYMLMFEVVEYIAHTVDRNSNNSPPYKTCIRDAEVY